MITERLVDEAKSYFEEFRGLDPCYEEIVSEADVVWVKDYKPMPSTFGYEIEQKDTDICYDLRRIYEWHYDLSGPLETALPPSPFPGRVAKSFIDNVKRYGCVWHWKNEFWAPPRWRGCGSHLHFRPRDDVGYVYENWLEAWATMHNTLVEVTPLIAPMFAWGRESFRYRREVLRWAKLVHRRLGPASMRRYLDISYTGHPYDSVALNRKIAGKPLTLEIRLNETHPAISFVVGILLNRIIRRCFERGFLSPKMKNRVEVINAVDRAITDSIGRGISLYETMEREIDEVGGITFTRTIPGLKRKYDSWGAFFDELLIEYMPSYPPKARVCRLFLHRGEPWKNPNAVWNTFAPMGEFRWDQPEIPVK